MHPLLHSGIETVVTRVKMNRTILRQQFGELRFGNITSVFHILQRYHKKWSDIIKRINCLQSFFIENSRRKISGIFRYIKSFNESNLNFYRETFVYHMQSTIYTKLVIYWSNFRNYIKISSRPALRNISTNEITLYELTERLPYQYYLAKWGFLYTQQMQQVKLLFIEYVYQKIRLY